MELKGDLSGGLSWHRAGGYRMVPPELRAGRSSFDFCCLLPQRSARGQPGSRALDLMNLAHSSRRLNLLSWTSAAPNARKQGEVWTWARFPLLGSVRSRPCICFRGLGANAVSELPLYELVCQIVKLVYVKHTQLRFVFLASPKPALNFLSSLTKSEFQVGIPHI